MTTDTKTATEPSIERTFPGWLPPIIFLLAIALAFPFWAYVLPVISGANSWFRVFTTIFLSIIIEAVPFVLIGVFVSAVIQVFISEDAIARIIPKSTLSGIVLAGLMGLIFPVCECGIVPVARRLMKKGVPATMGIAFLLAVPIVNPVVMAGTYYAFGDIKVAALRAGAGFIAAVTVALLLARSLKESPLAASADEVCETEGTCGCGHEHHHHEENGPWQKIMETLTHAGDEFFQMGKYLIIGAVLAATLQSAVYRDVLTSVGQSPVPSTLSMMGLAYGLSLCSEADAFIAATFVKSFTLPSILAFLIYGPMLDIKQTMMLMTTFKRSFVFRLIGVVTVTVFILALLLRYVA
jgi:uncharacterized membrane protein YraQ (UPF0718 family)